MAAEWQRSSRQRQERWQQKTTSRAGKEPGPAQVETPLGWAVGGEAQQPPLGPALDILKPPPGCVLVDLQEPPHWWPFRVRL